jgi:hypothetical protein
MGRLASQDADVTNVVRDTSGNRLGRTFGRDRMQKPCLRVKVAPMSLIGPRAVGRPQGRSDTGGQIKSGLRRLSAARGRKEQCQLFGALGEKLRCVGETLLERRRTERQGMAAGEDTTKLGKRVAIDGAGH